MDDILEFRKIIQEIMEENSKFFMSPDDLYFDSPVIDAIEMVGDHLVVWLN